MRMKIHSDIAKGGKLFFTSDEHYGHSNIIKYSERPFKDVNEMNETMIQRFNSRVPEDGLTIHAGDFYLGNDKQTVHQKIVSRLNGNHIFLMGSHDKWLDPKKTHEILEIRVNGQLIVICHYAMRTWPSSHYNSWHLFGHSHGRLKEEGKSLDVGVDTNDFYPYTLSNVESIMKTKPDNFNLVKDRRY